MRLESLLSILMRRDGLTKAEALQSIHEMKEEVAAGADPEDVLYDIGLEPDWAMDLLW